MGRKGKRASKAVKYLSNKEKSIPTASTCISCKKDILASSTTAKACDKCNIRVFCSRKCSRNALGKEHIKYCGEAPRNRMGDGNDDNPREPLRFKVGDKVQCNLDGGYVDAVVVETGIDYDPDWDYEYKAYRCKVVEDGSLIYAPYDVDACIRHPRRNGYFGLLDAIEYGTVDEVIDIVKEEGLEAKYIDS